MSGLTVVLEKSQSIKIGDDIEVFYKKSNTPGSRLTIFRIVAPRDKEITILDKDGNRRKSSIEDEIKGKVLQ